MTFANVGSMKPLCYVYEGIRMAGMPLCHVMPWQGSIPHTYRAHRVWHFSGVPTEITQPSALKNISVPTDLTQ
uniref:Uncharacterized protein n=1 Tax=Anguilla anguilla TaxID=7936 RepID=A0A0E9X3I8_ANGAN